MPFVIVPILVAVGLILGLIFPRKLLLAAVVIVGALFLVVVGSHYHVFR